VESLGVGNGVVHGCDNEDGKSDNLGNSKKKKKNCAGEPRMLTSKNGQTLVNLFWCKRGSASSILPDPYLLLITSHSIIVTLGSKA